MKKLYSSFSLKNNTLHNSTIFIGNLRHILAFSLLIAFLSYPTFTNAQYVVDFETATTSGSKTAYAQGNVFLNGIQWQLEQALIGTLANDKKNGARSMRMRRSGTTPGRAEMLSDLPDGISTVSFELARYGTEINQPALRIEYSLNGGSSWNLAQTFTVFPNSLTTQTVDINEDGNVRIRFITNTSGTNQRRFNIDDIVIEPFQVIAPCADVTWYYRTKQSGNWDSGSIWEASPNGVNSWVDANCPPDFNANIVTIQSGHNVSITSNLTIDQTIVEENATLIRSAGGLTINNGPGDDLIVFGTYRHAGSIGAPVINGSMRIKTHGTLEVTNNGTSASHYGQNTNIFFEDSAVYHWNVTSNALFQTANATYFPNAGPTERPIFRVTTPNINIGAGSVTRINGIFDVTQNNVSWQNGGDKIFRNGITGNGNVIQTSGSGRFILDGDTAYIGGNGLINLHASERLQTSGAVYVKLLNDKVINNGEFRITNPSTLDAAEYELSGSGNIQMNDRSTLITKHINGVDGTLSGLSGIIFENGYEQTVIFERDGTQNSGVNHLPDELGTVIVRNGSQLLLQKDLSIENLSDGYFEVKGSNSMLDVPNYNITLNINGNRSFILSDNGTMSDNCLDYLRFTTGGNSSTAVFNGNGEMIKCYNFTSSKSNSGGVILSANTPLYCFNNFEVDYFGGTATFIDNANVISVGDDLRLRGNASNFDFTGTFILTLINAGTGQADIEVESGNTTDAIQAELHNLVINNTTNNTANVRFQPMDASGTITIKNDFIIENMLTNPEILLGSNTYLIGGDYTNQVSSGILNEGTSTIRFNTNANQNINMPVGGEVFYNLEMTNGGNKILNNEDITVLNNLLIDGATSRIHQQNNDKTLYIGGDITLDNGGGFANNCFDNLEIRTIGNDNQTFNGNNSDFLCFNLRSDKSDGNLTIAANTSINAKNNIRIKFDGSGHVFSDGGNTITLGDDLVLTGLAERFDLTGTFVMTGENGNTNDIEDENSQGVNAVLNNLIIQGSGTNNHTRVRPNNGTHTLTLKGNLIIENSNPLLPAILNSQGNNFNVGGDWINNGVFQTYDMSVVTFNGSGTQLVDAGGDNFGKHFYEVVKTNSGSVLLASDISIQRNFTINDGEWDVSPSQYEMFVSGNWTHTSGIFNARDAVVTFRGDLDSDILGVNFNRLILDKSNDIRIAQTLSDFELTDELLIRNGIFLINTNHIIEAKSVLLESTANELRLENNSQLIINN